MIRVGLTGGIGSGKSRLAMLLRARGIPVFDCDDCARQLMNSDLSIQKEIDRVSGQEMFPGGVLDKAKMASFLFASSDNASLINGIVHPAVIAAYRKWCDELAEDGVGACAIESAILFESGLQSYVDVTVAVDAPEDIRVERAVLRDRSTREKIIERIRAQKLQCDVVALSDYVVDNSGDENELEIEADRLVDYIKLCVPKSVDEVARL